MIRQRVAECADQWFPGTGARPHVRLRRLVDRPRAVLYAVHVGHRTARPQVLAKVRRGWSDAVRDVGARPRLTPSLLPASEQTALEFTGLTAVQAMFGNGNPEFGAVRPLDHLADHDTVLMEYVAAPTLRDVLVGASRFSPRIGRRSRRGDEETWRRAGAWLRVFQQQMPAAGLPVRQATRDDVVDRFEAFGGFLTDRLGTRTAGEAVRSGARLAADVLPARLPLAVGHGDYAPRNVFLLEDDRLAVFDPLTRWRVPRVEDLCRFLVALRMQGLQLHTHGAAYSAEDLDRRERAVIDGYRGDGALPAEEMRCHQLLITLDKWAALVDSPSRSIPGKVRSASLRAASGYLRQETERLVRLVGFEPG
ncbi:hypothetical protein QOZ88_14225 [Blastococcus sp. BMG 814]|uniref:Phosphotransferase enzyme family protein n=1 Tax=Blastococcus carthaginiensis TaxID=3050034 RepID=A0ABT9IF20_9ACTN|nr:hypothetical protein [Blastococcus carthaginiensis]MDP5183792.1 hypothetical protein [Blastococcus carthaginiensis]